MDAGRQVLRLLADPFEPQVSESGKDRACRRRRTSAFPVKARWRGLEFKPDCLEVGQRGEAGGYCLR
jgi:hypothetical protein